MGNSNYEFGPLRNPVNDAALMADVLRVSEVRAFGDRPATEAYIARVTSRPAFRKAKADQLSHFKAADEKRAR